MPTIRGADTGSKKRYAGLLPGGKIVFKGLESVRSDWSPLAREFQKELYRRVFADEPCREYIQSLVADLRKGGLRRSWYCVNVSAAVLMSTYATSRLTSRRRVKPRRYARCAICPVCMRPEVG